MPVPDLKTPLPGPKAKAIIERDAAVVSPSYTRSYPFVMARGEGATVEDVDGNRFLDCAAGIAVNSTGHSHPAVVAAIVEQAAKFLHMSGTDFYYEPQVRLGEEMNAIAPWQGPKQSFFSNSGTEAIEAAVKLARYHTRRPGIIAFLGSFHGRTMGALSLTSSQAIQRSGFGPLCPASTTRLIPTLSAARSGRALDECAAVCVGLHRRPILHRTVSPDEVAADHRRADPGRRRLRRPAAGLPPAPARAARQARHPADRRRSAIGHGPHRQDVCDRALRRRARHRSAWPRASPPGCRSAR